MTVAATDTLRVTGAVRFAPTFDGWRVVARELVRDRVHPAAVSWEPTDDAQCGLDGLKIP